MIRVGLRLALASGREALTRLVVTAVAVGIGVALLLSVLAVYHGYEATANRPCWQCTGESGDVEQPAVSTAPGAADLWSYTEDFYAGHVIERVDVAALGDNAPLVPGLTRLPGAGEYYASPALARLIASVPPDQLGDRFPGARAGTIGEAGLSGPDDLAIVVGRPVAELAARPGTTRVTEVQTSPPSRSTSAIYRFGFVLGAIVLLVPLLILIANATRLAASRREERYAAMRLVGATTRQISVVASLDAVVGAAIGAALGIGLHQLLRPFLEGITITGDHVFPSLVTPTAAGYLGALVGVPLAAGGAALVALRRVDVSPLGVSRRVTPPAPRGWRALPLLVGMLLFVAPLLLGDAKNPDLGVAASALVLVMLGLLIGGPWLTMQASRLLSRLANGPSSLLAAHRLADNPRTAFRSVSGLVLAVFVGTLLASAVPAALAAQDTPRGSALDNLLRVPLGSGPVGVPSAFGARMISQIDDVPGATVLPVYAAPDAEHASAWGPPPTVFECRVLTQLPTLGRCAAGAAAVTADAGILLGTDNVAAINRRLPLVTSNAPPYRGDVDALNLQALLVKVDDLAALERVRTLLSVDYPAITGGGRGSSPQTFTEVAAVRGTLYRQSGQVTLLVVGVTLLVAGCGLVISMGGGIIERKRPFTLLRVAGTGTGVLHRVVLLETALPLVGATLIAAVAGFLLSIPIDRALSPVATGNSLRLPEHSYYVTLGAGLLVSLAIVVITLPMLARTTVPENARFE